VSRRSALYRGSVMHARTDEHARRTFRYPVYFASIDLAELAALDRELRWFSHGGANLFALHDRDYEGGAHGLVTSLADLLAANELPAATTTRLVTNLRVAGYVFNPVSFFLNYDAAGALASVIAEVNNTYGGRRRYVLGPGQRIVDDRRVGFRHVRELFVSPFLHGPASYDFWFEAPLDGDRLAITMHVARPAAHAGPAPETAAGAAKDDGGPPGSIGSGRRAARRGLGERIFVAELAGRRRALTDRALLAAAVRYPLMTAQVIGLIHYQALKLRLRGVPYFRPGPDHRPRPIAPPIRRRG
jgi:DUF1365 family protein